MGKEQSKESTENMAQNKDIEHLKMTINKQNEAVFKRDTNPQFFKMLTKEILSQYHNQNRLVKYYDHLCKFMEGINYSECMSFTAKMEYKILIKNLNEERIKSQIEYLSMKRTVIEDVHTTTYSNLPQTSYRNSCYKSSEVHNQYNRSVMIVHHKETSKAGEELMQYLSTEMFNKKGFFFLMAKCFGEIYSSIYSPTNLVLLTNLTTEDNSVEPMLTKSFKENKLKRSKSKRENPKIINDPHDNIITIALDEFRDFQSYLKNLMKLILPKETLDDYLETRLKKLLERLLLSSKLDFYKAIMDLIQIKNTQINNKLEHIMMSLREQKLCIPEYFLVPEEYRLKKEQIPYIDAIDCLNFLDMYTTAEDKINCIYKVKTFIYNSVCNYYTSKINGKIKPESVISVQIEGNTSTSANNSIISSEKRSLPISNKHVLGDTLDTKKHIDQSEVETPKNEEYNIQKLLDKMGCDAILPIMTYCVARSYNNQLYNHLIMIKLFKDNDLRNYRFDDHSSEKDYYLSTFEIALNYLLQKLC